MLADAAACLPGTARRRLRHDRAPLGRGGARRVRGDPRAPQRRRGHLLREFDKNVYHLLDGEARAHYRPAALPPASRLLPASRLFKPDDDDSIPTPPSQKALSAVLNHHRWLELLDKAHGFDSTATDTSLDHHEATRLISASQFGSGAWLEVTPDVSLPFTRSRSGPYTIALQRRFGLYIESARGENNALEAAGNPPDWLGDAACNEGQHSTRHHAVNRAWHAALSAVATGTVLLGDKQEADKYKQYNAGHVPDLIKPVATPRGAPTGSASQKCPRPCEPAPPRPAAGAWATPMASAPRRSPSAAHKGR